MPAPPRGLNFQRADLSEARLQAANLSGANLDDAEIRQTQIDTACAYPGMFPKLADGFNRPPPCPEDGPPQSPKAE